MLFARKIGFACGALAGMMFVGTASAQTITRSSTGRSTMSSNSTKSYAPQTRYAAPVVTQSVPAPAARPAPTTVVVNKPVVSEKPTVQPIAAAPVKESPTGVTTKEATTSDIAAKPKPAVVTNGCNAVENEIIAHTNAQRVRHGLRPLMINHGLMNTARAHAGWMARARTMQHGSYNVAENIAAGQPNTASAMNSWMNSSGHRANILGGYSSIGVAAMTGANGQVYWCQQFR